MRILGIDPGFERLGIAVLEKVDKKTAFVKNSGVSKEAVIFSECFKTSAKLEFSERLKTNQKTVMRVAEARGVAVYEGAQARLRVFEATPLQIKVAVTGYGRSDKTQINKMVKILVEIDSSKRSDDELDAIAIALTAFAHLKF